MTDKTTKIPLTGRPRNLAESLLNKNVDGALSLHQFSSDIIRARRRKNNGWEEHVMAISVFVLTHQFVSQEDSIPPPLHSLLWILQNSNWMVRAGPCT